MPVLGLLLALLLGACVSAPSLPPADSAARHELILVRHRWHTGIVVARGDLLEAAPHLGAYMPAGRWLEIGWGEERYYQARTATFSMGLRAVLVPGPAAMQVVGLELTPDLAFPLSPSVAVRLSPSAYHAALMAMTASFSLDTSGAPQPLGTSLYGQGHFYRADGRFHAFNTCNTWVAKVLQKAGLRLSSRPIVTATGLFAAVAKHAEGR